MPEGAAPKRRSLSAETLLNMAIAAVSGIGAQLVVLAVTPLLIWTIGLERYGFWALCSSISRYGMLTDVLFAPIITNVASAARADDLARVRKIATFASLFYGGLFAVFVPLAYVAGGYLPRAFHLSHALDRDAPLFFTGYVAYFFASVAVTGLASVLNGLGLLRKAAAINAFGTMLFATVAVVFALRGYGMWALLDGLAVQLVFTAIALYALCRERLRHVFVAPMRIERKLIVDLLAFGGWVQLSTFATLLGGETDQILIGAFVGVPAVGLYEVGSKLARAIRSLSSFPNSALMPSIAAYGQDRVTEVGAGGRGTTDDRFPTIVSRASRLVSVVTIFTAAVLIGGSAPIVHVWLGGVRDIAIAVVVLVVLSLNNVLETIVSVPLTAMRALGRPKYEALATGIGALVNIAITIALVRPFGVGGVLAGTLCGTIAYFALFYALFARTHRISIVTTLFAWLVPLSIAGVACAIALHVVFTALGGSDVAGAAHGTGVATVGKGIEILRLVIAGASGALVYALAVRVLGVFAPGELRQTLTAARSPS